MTSAIKKIFKKTFLYNIRLAYLLKKQKRKENDLYLEDLKSFKISESLVESRFNSTFDLYPILEDKVDVIPIEPHYTYHPAWAARILAQTKPQKHVDISSILYFSTLVSAFIPIDFYDYRPANVNLSNLKSEHADLTALPFEDNSISSLSCMHTIEHIGLGRYGDPIDYDGDLKAIKELIRVLAIGGDLLMVTPIGKPKIAYNAHRVYSHEQITSYFSELQLIEFSLIADEFGVIKDASKELSDQQEFGCGCFWFKKTKP